MPHSICRAAALFLCGLFQFRSEANAQVCPNPLSSILATLECVEEANVTCALSGYDGAQFVKLHNGVDTNTTIDNSGSFWAGTFSFIEIGMEINHKMNFGTNQASLRYVETVTVTDGSSLGLPPSNDYPFGQIFVQHEHALVTVDNECRMILWDQYGNNKEQAAVSSATDAILCIIGFLPAEVCTAQSANLTADQANQTDFANNQIDQVNKIEYHSDNETEVGQTQTSSTNQTYQGDQMSSTNHKTDYNSPMVVATSLLGVLFVWLM